MKFAIIANFLFVASVAAFPVGEVKDTTTAVKALQKSSEDQPVDDLQTAASFNFGASDLGLAKGALSWDFRPTKDSSSSSSSEEEKEEHTHFNGHFHGGHEHENVHYGGHPVHGHGGRQYGGNAVHGGNGEYGDTISYWGKPYVAYSGGWWQ